MRANPSTSPPQGYEPHELPADYTGPLFTQGQMMAVIYKAYKEGLAEGIHEYAHYKDGQTFVGTCGTTLAEALRRVDALD